MTHTVEQKKLSRWAMSRGRTTGDVEITAYEKDAALGFIQLRECHEDASHRYVEFVHVEEGGRGRGVGGYLYAQAAELLGYAPAPGQILETAQAQAFWAKQGFTAGLYEI